MSVVRACGPLERPREIYDARQKLSAPVSAVDDNGPPCGVPLEGSTPVTMSPRVAQGNSKFSFRGCPTNYSNFPLSPPPPPTHPPFPSLVSKRRKRFAQKHNMVLTQRLSPMYCKLYARGPCRPESREYFVLST